MPLFKLDKFPHVCRLCLKPNSREEVTAVVNTKDPILDGNTIGEFISALSFVIPQDKHDFLPQRICLQCLEMLRFFAKYRKKVMLVQLLMNSLVELKLHNPAPLTDLFQSKEPLVKALFKDLDLCNRKSNFTLQDLLNEFPTYELAKAPLIYDEDMLPMGEQPEGNAGLVFEECTFEELADVTKEEPNAANKQSSISGNQNPVSRYRGGKLDEPINCNECDFKTYYQLSLDQHQRACLKRQNHFYPCKEPGCEKVFTRRSLLQSHKDSAHKGLICDVCGNQLNQHELKDHMARHAKQYKHACPYCQNKYNVKGDLNTHIKQTHLAERSHICDICGLGFTRKDHLRSHKLSHSDVYDFPCTQCDKKFKKKESLTSHVKKIHDMVRHICEHCDASFNKRGKLLDHTESAHRIQCRYICDVCVKVFDSEKDLAAHQDRHESPKELECARCLTLFVSQDQLCEHMCFTYRDDYICCGRDHRHHQMYNKHMFIEHGVQTNVRVKPVPGQLLGVMRAKRKRHEQCPKCKQFFDTRTQRKKHMETCVEAAD